jgi:hypothetical protein
LGFETHGVLRLFRHSVGPSGRPVTSLALFVCF